MKKVLLINPPEVAQGVGSTPTIGMLWLVSYLRQHGIDPIFADGWVMGWEGVEEQIIKHCPDIVGITGITGARHRSFKVVEMVKRINPGILVVFGGIHATIMWKQVLERYPSIDIIVRGEGEVTLLEIAQDRPLEEIDGICYRKDGRVVRNKDRELISNLDEIPFPAWDVHDLRVFGAPNNAKEGEVINGIDASKEPVAPIIFSRGCPGRCNFCSTWWIWKHWRCRSAKNITDEIEYLHNEFNIKHFKFLDDCFTVDRNAIIQFCDEIERRKLRIAFTVQTRGDCIDQEVLERLHGIGNYLMEIGVESGSQKILDIMGKNTDLKKLEENIMLAKKIGYKVNQLLIVGNIGETIDTVNETIKFVKRTDPDVTSVGNGIMIFPGTSVYQHAKRAGLIDDDFWFTDHPYMMYTHEHSKAMLDAFTHAVYNRRLLPRSKFRLILQNHRYFSRALKDRACNAIGIKKKEKKRIKGYYPR